MLREKRALSMPTPVGSHCASGENECSTMSAEPLFKGSALWVPCLYLCLRVGKLCLLWIQIPSEDQAQGCIQYSIQGPQSISTKLLSFYWRYQAELGSLLINALWILLVSPRAKSNSLFFHWWSCLFLFSPWKIQVVFWILPFLPKLTYHPFPSQGRGVSKRQLSAYHSSPSFPNIRIHYHLHVPSTVPNISLKLLWQLQ